MKAAAIDTSPGPGRQGEATRQAILDAAEDMFAEHGIYAVSVRSLMVRAGTNVAAAHYHFGSKENLVEQVFARRAVRIAEQREQMLEQIPDGLSRRERLEHLVTAFIRPGFLGGADTEEGAATFAKLRARLTTDTGDTGRQLLSKYFNESSGKFLRALGDALPHLTTHEVQWRFHAMLGVMVYTMANPGRIQSLSDNACDPSNLTAALNYYVPYLAQMFDAPPVMDADQTRYSDSSE